MVTTQQDNSISNETDTMGRREVLGLLVFGGSIALLGYGARIVKKDISELTPDRRAILSELHAAKLEWTKATIGKSSELHYTAELKDGGSIVLKERPTLKCSAYEVRVTQGKDSFLFRCSSVRLQPIDKPVVEELFRVAAESSNQVRLPILQ